VTLLCECRHWIAHDAVVCRVCGRALQGDAVAYDLVLPDGTRVGVADAVTIGRSEDNTVSLDDPSVSRRHARVLLENGHAVLEDIGSRYGTMVGGERMSAPRRMADGATFRVGETELTLERRRAAYESSRTRVAPLMRPATLTMTGIHPEQRPLIFKRLDSDEGSQRYVLKDPDSGRYKLLTARDGQLAEHMDGRTPFAELLAESERLYGERGPDRLQQLMVELGDFGCMVPDAHDESEPSLRRRIAVVVRPRTWASARAGRSFTALYRRGGWVLFSRLGLATLLAIAAVGLPVFAAEVVAGDLAPLSVKGQLTLGALALLLGRLVLVLAHELAHGLALTCVGRSVSLAGLKLALVFPYAFVDTSEVWFEPRKHRIAVSLAGPSSDLVLGGLCAIISVVGPSDTVREVAFQVALAGYLGAFYNLNPLLERDGYHALSDALKMPDLRRRAQARIAGAPSRRPGEDFDPRPKLRWYATAALAWTAAAVALTAVLFGRQRARIADTIGDTPALIVTVGACAAVAVPLLVTYGPPLLSRLRRATNRDG
jgi:putative peptide zinc metalloprotease protein